MDGINSQPGVCLNDNFANLTKSKLTKKMDFNPVLEGPSPRLNPRLRPQAQANQVIKQTIQNKFIIDYVANSIKIFIHWH